MGLFSLEKLFGMTIRESATDGSDFTNPDADYRRLFLGEDGALHLKDSSGTVTDIGGAAGAVATDAIWDAAGDLAVGTGANTAAKLAKGAAGGVLAMGNGAVIWNAGTSFPGSKATNDRYWRTDLGMGFIWDGTRWVSEILYDNPIEWTQGTQPIVGTSTPCRTTAPYGGTYDIWIVSWECWFFGSGGSAYDGSNKWVLDLVAQGAQSTLSTFTINSGAKSAYRTTGQAAVGALLGTTNYALETRATMSGSPGSLFVGSRWRYRIVVT